MVKGKRKVNIELWYFVLVLAKLINRGFVLKRLFLFKGEDISFGHLVAACPKEIFFFFSTLQAVRLIEQPPVNEPMIWPLKCNINSPFYCSITNMQHTVLPYLCNTKYRNLNRDQYQSFFHFPCHQSISIHVFRIALPP